jgi:hypothetical protein
MKIPRILFVIILLCPIFSVFSQSFTDFFVIDEIAENYTQLQSEFGNQPNVFWTNGTAVNAVEQISNASRGMKIANLHIYAPTKPGALVFNSIAITPNDVDDVAELLKAWSNVVTKQVVIHSEVVFSGDEGSLLKQRLEEITGLVFTTQN